MRSAKLSSVGGAELSNADSALRRDPEPGDALARKPSFPGRHRKVVGPKLMPLPTSRIAAEGLGGVAGQPCPHFYRWRGAAKRSLELRSRYSPWPGHRRGAAAIGPEVSASRPAVRCRQGPGSWSPAACRPPTNKLPRLRIVATSRSGPRHPPLPRRRSRPITKGQKAGARADRRPSWTWVDKE